MTIVQIFAVLIVSRAQIYYDGGFYDGFSFNACDLSSSSTKKFYFSSTFQAVPEVVYNIGTFAIQSTVQDIDSQIISEIIAKTTTYFQMKVSCPLSTGFSTRFYINWYAFSVPRMTVITSSLVQNPQNGEIYTHPHSNIFATQGFVVLTSLEYLGKFSFYLEVYNQYSLTIYCQQHQLRPSDVFVKNLGYLVVIGPDNAFTQSILKQHASYSSPIITLPTDGYLFVPMTGFGWTDTQPRVNLTVTNSPPTASYSAGTFSTTVLSQITYQEICFINRIIYPMYFRKYRITQNKIDNIDYPVKAIFDGQTYTAIGSYVQHIPAASLSAVITISMQFQPNKTLQGTISKCSNCGSKFFDKITKPYLSTNNLIVFKLELNQYQSYDIKEFIITITSTGVAIKQLATVTDDKATILNLQFI